MHVLLHYIYVYTSQSHNKRWPFPFGRSSVFVSAFEKRRSGAGSSVESWVVRWMQRPTPRSCRLDFESSPELNQWPFQEEPIDPSGGFPNPNHISMTQFVAYVSLTQTQYQWSFQEPIDWRYQSHIFLVYFSGLNFREYPHNIWPKIWYSTSNLGS